MNINSVCKSCRKKYCTLLFHLYIVQVTDYCYSYCFCICVIPICVVHIFVNLLLCCLVLFYLRFLICFSYIFKYFFCISVLEFFNSSNDSLVPVDGDPVTVITSEAILTCHVFFYPEDIKTACFLHVHYQI